MTRIEQFVFCNVVCRLWKKDRHVNVEISVLPFVDRDMLENIARVIRKLFLKECF